MVSKNYQEHKELLRLVARTKINVYDFQSSSFDLSNPKSQKDVGIRRRSLQTILYYSKVNWVDGEKIPIDEVPDEAICKIFLGHYKRAKRDQNPNQKLLFAIY